MGRHKRRPAPLTRMIEAPMLTRRSLLFALPLLLVACDAQRTLAPDATVLFNNKPAPSQGLFRIESPMFPFYSRTELADGGGFGYRTDQWAAIVFYRDPSCVPADFNLFEFYDVPGAFFCDSRVDGFSLHLEPLGMTPPKVSQLHGSAVPIWFVPWDAPIQLAIQNEVLTRAQLEAMPGLVRGVATNFREVLMTVESHPRPKINITARGYIAGGGSFRYNVNWSGVTAAEVKNVKIEID